MSEALKRKLREAMANRNIPLTLTDNESAELDTYLLLVGYFHNHGTTAPIGRA